jgi:hypothetical protein
MSCKRFFAILSQSEVIDNRFILVTSWALGEFRDNICRILLSTRADASHRVRD